MDKEKITLYCQEGTSNKLYVIWIEPKELGYVVLAQWGGVGKALQSGTKTPEPITLDKAKTIMEKVIKTKVAKGYKTYGDKTPAYTHVNGAKDTGVRVMLLTPSSEEDLDRLINSDDWGAQEKKNGKHITTTITNDSVIGSNRNGLECPLPNNVVDELSKFKSAPLPLILDGELIGDIFHVFDIVKKDNQSMISRYILLDQFSTILNSKNIQIVPLIIGTDNKTNLVKNLKARHKEGVVFKKIEGRYMPGKILNLNKAIAIKVKFYSEGSFIVDHWNEKNSISIHAFKGKSTVQVGNVTVPEKYKPQIVVGGIVSVRYLYATDASILYLSNLNPDDNGEVMRDDIPKEDCVIEQLKYEGKEEVFPI